MDPIPTWVRRLWDMWDLRMLVLLSLTLQIILYIFGNRRKYMTSLWVRIIVWVAYLTADWVATVALGKLSDAMNSQNINDPNNALQGIWAPLLLLHLGGPDTITAYALEDNQLWLRHFLGMLVQVAVAIYAILLSWRHSWFSTLTFPVLVAGIMKYGERTWVLWLASNNQDKNTVPLGCHLKNTAHHTACPDARETLLAHDYLLVFMPHKDKPRSGYMRSYGADDRSKFWEAFEIEMGLIYDLLYTKVPIIYTNAGWIVRAISFSFTITVLVGFFLIIFMEENSQKHYGIVDIALTGVLLVGAFVLEIYAITLILSSEWTLLWLMTQDNLLSQFLRKFPWLVSLHKKRRWSNSVGQFNLLSYCLKDKSPKLRVLKLFHIQEMLDKYSHKTRVDHVPQHLKDKILHFILSTDEITGQKALQDCNCFQELEKYTKSNLDERILIWHTATELLIQDSDTASASVSASTTNNQQRTLSKLLSDYMLYLLVICPSMLPIRYPDLAFSETTKLINLHISAPQQEKLHTFPTRCREDNIVMGPGFEIADILKRKGDDKWEILSSVWVEILCYAAKNCQQDKHAQQLRRGGELLTLVWRLIGQLIEYETEAVDV
ncbi:hypothetical protein F0562_030421 [Nyssa sinensis]|uniref:DUF4220 domain-containing protein n=1 Tax=Nyssa sinensis TaxID=561372 RepID=A0A5J5AYT5_9ASTE|nr:hypothetical protein F0562_030421 [Nyssa sinensis]